MSNRRRTLARFVRVKPPINPPIKRISKRGAQEAARRGGTGERILEHRDKRRYNVIVVGD